MGEKHESGDAAKRQDSTTGDTNASVQQTDVTEIQSTVTSTLIILSI